MLNDKNKLTLSILSICLAILITAIGVYNNQLSNSQILSIVLVVIFIISYIYNGFSLFKKATAFFVIMYSISMYNLVAMEASNYVIQPAFLTIASITSFLAITYRSHISGERSRPLWTSVFAILLSAIKSSTLIAFENLVLTETIGAITTVIGATLWIIWIDTSNKTKRNAPDHEVIEYDNLRLIKSNDKLDTKSNQWMINRKNAKPFLINEILKAKEDKKILAIHNIGDDKHYREVELNSRQGVIKYIYMESKDNELDELVNAFQSE